MARMDAGPNPILGTPRWAGDYVDPKISFAHFPAKVDASAFTDKDAVTVTVSGANAQGATTMNISAITFPAGVTKIPKGTTLYFGTDEIAVLTADYTSGTTMSVAALPNALEGGETATYLPYGTRVAIPAGTLVGRTFAERDASTNFGPAHYQDDEFYIVMYDMADANIDNNIPALYRNGRTVKENYLPQWTSISGNANLLATLRSKYVCVKGVN